MVAVGLMAILVLTSMRMSTFISNSVYKIEVQEKTVALDVDLANLMVIPQLCTCNLTDRNGAGPLVININNLNEITELEALNFYTDPAEDLTTPSCNRRTPVIQTSSRHLGSELILGRITIGPFSPLGDRNTSNKFLTTIKVENWDSTSTSNASVRKAKNRDAEVKVVLTTTGTGNARTVSYCGVGNGNAPATTTGSFGQIYYRFVQYSMNFGCSGVPGTEHPEQVEPYVMMRNQYFWPAEEGNLITEFESTRLGASPVAPVSFSAFAGTAVCFEDIGIGDRARLILPGHNLNQCPAAKTAFLSGNAQIVDVGFSLKDNCRSRFF